MKIKLKNVILGICVFILIIIAIIIVSSTKKENTSKISNTTVENQQSNETANITNQITQTESIVDNKISKLSEAERARSYFGKFINAIEAQNYETAYNYLNDDFRKNYFKNLEEFTAYIQEKYPKKKAVVKYNSVNKKGEIFVLKVTINDNLDDNYQPLDQTIVIREVGMNNFSLSFSKE